MLRRLAAPGGQSLRSGRPRPRNLPPERRRAPPRRTGPRQPRPRRTGPRRVVPARPERPHWHPGNGSLATARGGGQLSSTLTWLTVVTPAAPNQAGLPEPAPRHRCPALPGSYPSPPARPRILPPAGRQLTVQPLDGVPGAERPTRKKATLTSHREYLLPGARRIRRDSAGRHRATLRPPAGYEPRYPLSPAKPAHAPPAAAGTRAGVPSGTRCRVPTRTSCRVPSRTWCRCPAGAG